MTSLEQEIIEVLEDAPANRTSQVYLIDEVDLRVGEFDMDEFDDTLESLREEGAIRIRDPSAPDQDRLIQYLGGVSGPDSDA